MTADLVSLAGQPVIVGAGLAGLATALFMAPQPVVLLTKAPLGGEASSPWAQGGLAASLGDDDTPDLHHDDTLAAGDGLCDASAVRRIVEAAPEAIARLASLGVGFDRHESGFRLGLEAAHSRNRIVHADGDGTGREIIRALVDAVRRTPSITALEHVEARRLLLDGEGRVAGLLVAGPVGAAVLATTRVVLATGGIGGLYDETTNPLACFGQGLSLAARAGAVIADPEFVQFHPTAFASAARPMKLISEAVRGEGAFLIDEDGRRFLAGEPGAELAPRDVVARAVWRELSAGHSVFIDARENPGAGFSARFPAIARFCREAGLDPARDPIPIRPAAHYHMGGIAVNANGQTSVEGLWAAGEVASTGLHGANRLASNSLTEAAVAAASVAASLGAAPTRAFRPVPLAELPTAADPSSVRPLLSRHVGVLRDGQGLASAISALLPRALGQSAAADPALVGLIIAVAAFERRESRGAHCRTDYPERAATAIRTRMTAEAAFAAAQGITESAFPSVRSA